MKQSLLFILLLLLFSRALFAQIAVNTDGSQPDNSAILDVKSFEKGVLVPRMTLDQISMIPNPVDGLIVYCTTDHKFYAYTGTTYTWRDLMFGSNNIAPVLCGSPFIDNRDGKLYHTVQIGNNCWMKENLNVGERIDGTVSQTNNNIIEKYCYADVENNCTTYGGLYTWNEMMQYSITEGVQGICPTGWHVSTFDEWWYLNIYLGGDLKELGTVHWASPNTGATNSSGFTALPSGNMSTGPTLFTDFWISHGSGTDAYYRELYYNTATLISGAGTTSIPMSVRCVRN